VASEDFEPANTGVLVRGWEHPHPVMWFLKSPVIDICHFPATRFIMDDLNCLSAVVPND